MHIHCAGVEGVRHQFLNCLGGAGVKAVRKKFDDSIAYLYWNFPNLSTRAEKVLWSIRCHRLTRMEFESNVKANGMFCLSAAPQFDSSPRPLSVSRAVGCDDSNWCSGKTGN